MTYEAQKSSRGAVWCVLVQEKWLTGKIENIKENNFVLGYSHDSIPIDFIDFSTWHKVDKWMEQLAPDVSHDCVTSTHFFNMVDSARNTFLKLFPDRHEDFLAQRVDLDFISSILSSFGITKTNIGTIPKEPVLPQDLPNQFVLDLEQFRTSQNLPKKLTFSWINFFTGFDMSRMQYAVNITTKKYYSLLRNKHRNPDAVKDFCMANFSLPGQSASPTPMPKQTAHEQTACTSTPKHTKAKKCTECVELVITNESLMTVINSLQNENSEVKKSLDMSHKSLKTLEDSFSVKEEKLRRKSELSKETFKKKLESSRRHCKALSKDVVSLKDEQECLKTKLSKSQRCMKECLKESEVLKEEIVRLNAKEDMKNDANVNESVNVKMSFKNAYSEDIRKTAIQLQCEAGVSASNVSKVIKCVAGNIFHHKFKNLPCQKSALNMCDEGYAISQIQATEALLESEHVTIHSDGTSRDCKKIVSEQLSTDKGKTIYLGYTPVASEDANTLLNVTLNTLRRMSESSCDIVSLSSDELLSQISSKISSTMSDRAASMKLWGKKLNDHFKSEMGGHVTLKFLHCNAHFLLGLSSKCEKGLLLSETILKNEMGCSLGRDVSEKFFKTVSESATSRVIRTTCDVLGPRGDQKNGRHADWITHCPDTIIPSFKSNRFNCFFAAAAAIIFHRPKILSFFSSGILDEDHLNLKLQSVCKDVQDENLMCFLSVVALFYLKVTGPYWVLINSDVQYADFHIYVKDMFAAFETMTVNPNQLLDPNMKSVFGDRITFKSPTWDIVHSFIESQNKSLLESAIQNLAKESLVVTQSQLADFLPGGNFEDVDEITKKQIFHCPITNLIGEGSFGDFDFDCGKRRNASLHNRSAIHVVKRNKTVKYLSKKSKKEQMKIFSHARKMGRILGKENRTLEENVRLDIKQKFADNQQKKIDKMQAALSRHSKAIDSVKNHGGPCSTPEDVDNLVDRLKHEKKSERQVTEVLKAEIRYQKEMFGQKLKFGDKLFMIGVLKRCLAVSPTEPPAAKRQRCQ